MPHRKTIRHYHEPGHLHEFTFSCYQRRPLLTNDPWREKLARCLDEANIEHRFELVAFVFMPEHVHLLTYPLDEKPEFARYLAHIKQPFSKQIKQILVEHRSPLLNQLTVRERKDKFCFRFWQEGPGFDRIFFQGSDHWFDQLHSRESHQTRFVQESHRMEVVLGPVLFE